MVGFREGKFIPFWVFLALKHQSTAKCSVTCPVQMEILLGSCATKGNCEESHICSMYVIFIYAYIWLKFLLNAGDYTRNGVFANMKAMEVSAFKVPGNSCTTCWIQWRFHMISLGIPIKECKLWKSKRSMTIFWRCRAGIVPDLSFGWYDNPMNSSHVQNKGNNSSPQIIIYLKICTLIFQLTSCNFKYIGGMVLHYFTSLHKNERPETWESKYGLASPTHLATETIKATKSGCLLCLGRVYCFITHRIYGMFTFIWLIFMGNVGNHY